jgi:hypothetical protein
MTRICGHAWERVLISPHGVLTPPRLNAKTGIFKSIRLPGEGWHVNRLAATISYTLVHCGSGRIYALDVGKEDHNPDCQNTGELHNHRWREQVRDKEAYTPENISAPVSDPVAIWKEFCAEAKIQHAGTMHQTPPLQLKIL